VKFILTIIVLSFVLVGRAEEELAHHKGFSVMYDHDARIPHWVFYTWTPANAIERCKRLSGFAMDPILNSVSTRLYTNTGYDRGHMVPAEDRQSDPELMRETFYTSNIIPEVPAINRGIDKKMEEYHRKVPARYAIFVGVVYSSDSPRVNGITIPNEKYRVVINTDTGDVKVFRFKNE